MHATENALLDGFLTYLAAVGTYAESTIAQYHSVIAAAIRHAEKDGIALPDYIAKLSIKSRARTLAAFKAWTTYLNSLHAATSPTAEDGTREAITALIQKTTAQVVTPLTITPRIAWALWQLTHVWIQPVLLETWTPGLRAAKGPSPKERWRHRGATEMTPYGVLSVLDWSLIHFSTCNEKPCVSIDDLDAPAFAPRVVTPVLQNVFTLMWQAGTWEGTSSDLRRPFVPERPRATTAMSARRIHEQMELYPYIQGATLPPE